MTNIANRYEILSELGTGGMGTVYKATDTLTNQTVAIKRLKNETVEPNMLERFRREGEMLRDLNHPNIVKLLDAFSEADQHYLVMEYVEGGDLTHLLSAGKIPLEQVLRLSIDLADALTRAHKLDIIHRDLKPANVLIGKDGVLRLSDFGIAHMQRNSQLTQTNAPMGTIRYIAPEYLNGEPPSPKVDIWAFGVMLVEMLTGQYPFAGESLTELLLSILVNPLPDLEAIAPHAPMGLLDLIYRMMERDPQARISSVRYVGAELEDILRGRVNTPPANRFVIPVSNFVQRPRHNLPAQATPFVGRETELSEVAKLLDDPKIRLVTILAPGGMGKTRLSLEAAACQIPNFEDGVYVVELAPLSDAETIIPAIAEATSFQFQSDERSQKQQVLDFLRAKKLLLVMDNYEHLLDGAALVTDILKAAPNVKILVTSRQRLNQAGETLLHLSGMEFPKWETPADALEYAAVKLFMNSAQRAKSDFELTQESLDYVARICRLVQGMPLGIVLAAAWLAILTPQEIAAELQQNMDILTDEAGAVPERQQSIRAVFEYSWQTMTETEQNVFMQMSVFRGGFSRNAVQSITAATLQQLMGLVNKSLIHRDNNTGRYEIHELLRQYAAEKLVQSGNESDTRTAHMTYYASGMREREAYLKDSREIQALDEIEDDFENVRAAWFWAIEQQDEQALDAMLASLTQFGELRNRATECLELFEATASLEAVIAQLVWGRLLARRGFLHIERKHFKEAELALSAALTSAREYEQQADIAFTLWKLALAIDERGEKEQALKQAEESLALYQRLGDADGEAALYYYIGYLYGSRLDNPKHAAELTKKSYAIAQTFGKPTRIASCLHNLGIWEVFLGDMNAGEAYLHDSVRLGQQAKRVGAVVFSMSALMWVDVYHGRFEQAEAEATEMIHIATDSGNQLDIYASHCNLAALRTVQERYQETLTIATAMRKLIESYTPDSQQYTFHETTYGWALCGMGNYAEAAIWLNQALLHAAVVAQPAQLNFILLGKSILFAAKGIYERALEVLALVRNDPSTRTWRDRLPLALCLMEQLKAHFGEATYNALYERGAKLNWRETVNQLAAEVAEDNR